MGGGGGGAGAGVVHGGGRSMVTFLVSEHENIFCWG